jgi:hypothetical protein
MSTQAKPGRELKQSIIQLIKAKGQDAMTKRIFQGNNPYSNQWGIIATVSSILCSKCSKTMIKVSHKTSTEEPTSGHWC